MATWFATTASLTAILKQWPLTPFESGLLTSAVQAGFVLGTFTSALFSAADRFELRRLFAISAAMAGIANLVIVLVPPTHPLVPAMRLLTGFCMAGVYPVGMKLASTWARGDLGLLIGLLVGALTLGSASPHLFAATAALDWRLPCIVAGICALFAAALIHQAKVGPGLAPAPPFRLSNALEAWRRRPVRLANLGYFGHMWELYAMWAWIGSFVAASLAQRYGASPPINPNVATFLIVGSGAVGALLGGWFADRIGRTLVTMASMAISGVCAILIGQVYGASAGLLLLVGVVWGITIVSDSAQFSASVTELSDRNLVGTMLTVQTCVGFLLTLLTIHLMPYAVDAFGWQNAFSILAIGPFLGIVAMYRLRQSPDSVRLASGRR